MANRSLAWLVALPLAAAGALAGHVAAPRLVAPQDHGAALAEPGNGHMAGPAAPLAALLGLASGGAAAIAARTAAGRAGIRWPLTLVALIAPVAFLSQEATERLAAAGTTPVDIVAEPSVTAGLALQAPFMVLAYLAARWLCRVAKSVGKGLGALPASPGREATFTLAEAASLPMRCVPVLANAGRGPPSLR